MSTETLSVETPKAPSVNFWVGLRDFFVHAVGQLRILRKAYPGIMHFLIFWGMTIQIVGTIISLMQIQLFVPFVELGDLFPLNKAYLGFELTMDLGGVAIIVGALMAAFRRLVLRPKTLETRWDDWYAIGILLLVPLVGFTTEALRFVAVSPPWSYWSPAGNLVAIIFRGFGMTPQTAWNLHYGMYWTHIAVGLIFIASIPFTKLRHLVTGPLNIVLRDRRDLGALPMIHDIEEAEVLGASSAAEFTSKQLMSLDACLNCGRCEEVCPASNSGLALSPRKVIQSLRGAMVDTMIVQNGDKGTDTPLTEWVGLDPAWQCTTCGACVEACPVFIDPITEMIDMRRSDVLMTGEVPGSAGLALRNIERQNNPWGLPASDRIAWAEEADVRILEPDDEVDVLFFVGCAGSYDDLSRKGNSAFVHLMKSAGVDFGIMADESCCGETARRLGNEYIAQVLMEQNIETFGQYKFKRIVTQCPHCFNTLKNEYPQLDGEYEVIHYTELLSEITPDLPISQADLGRVTYHDSCYLGRYNDIYDQPRKLLNNAGIKLTEMSRSRENAFCCGGGGGQMWMETEADTRINHTRLTDALDIEADVVATACPYCAIMFDDAIRSQGRGEQIQVADIATLLESHLQE